MAPRHDEKRVEDRIGGADRYCRACLYCLGDLTEPGAPSVCPECGGAFDREDPRATLLRPRQPRSIVLRWPVLAVLTALAIVFLARFNLLPVPLAGGGGAVWRWHYHEYGYSNGLWWWAGTAYGETTESRNGVRFTSTLHAGVARQVVAVAESDGHPVFTVERSGDPPVWSIRVDDHALAWPVDGGSELIRAINLTREHRFGVTVYPPDGSTRRTPPGPIIASGTEADIFWAYVRAYALETDLPERVPRASDGWHPTLGPGQDVVYPSPDTLPVNMRPRSIYRR
jgi:hypothetical protein